MFKIQITTLNLIAIPVVNYNANTLITTLKMLINDSNFSMTISHITCNLTFSHNKKFTIYTNNENLISYILAF